MKINWKVRLRNKAFWVAFVPALLLAVQAALRLGGIDWQPGDLEAGLLHFIDALFALLAVVGVVTDPTTTGWGDSDRAMTYETPGGEV